MTAAELYAMMLAVITKKPVLVVYKQEEERITHECEGVTHDGFKINCDVYNRFLRDARDFAQAKGRTGKDAGEIR